MKLISRRLPVIALVLILSFLMSGCFGYEEDPDGACVLEHYTNDILQYPALCFHVGENACTTNNNSTKMYFYSDETCESLGYTVTCEIDNDDNLYYPSDYTCP